MESHEILVCDCKPLLSDFKYLQNLGIEPMVRFGGLYWTRTSDLLHVKETRYQLRQETMGLVHFIFK